MRALCFFNLTHQGSEMLIISSHLQPESSLLRTQGGLGAKPQRYDWRRTLRKLLLPIKPMPEMPITCRFFVYRAA